MLLPRGLLKPVPCSEKPKQGEKPCVDTPLKPSWGARASSHAAQVTHVWVRKETDSSSPQPRASPAVQVFPNETPDLSVFHAVS